MVRVVNIILKNLNAKNLRNLLYYTVVNLIFPSLAILSEDHQSKIKLEICTIVHASIFFIIRCSAYIKCDALHLYVPLQYKVTVQYLTVGGTVSMEIGKPPVKRSRFKEERERAKVRL